MSLNGTYYYSIGFTRNLRSISTLSELLISLKIFLTLFDQVYVLNAVSIPGQGYR